MKLPQLVAMLIGLRLPPSVGELKQWLEHLHLAEVDLKPHVRFAADTYRRNLVAEGPHFEVKLLCWRAGQCSPIHDHAGSACGVKVLSGIATETVYDVAEPARPRRASARRLRPGSVTASFDRDAHRIAAADGDLVTLHVYAPKLRAMTLYPDGSA